MNVRIIPTVHAGQEEKQPTAVYCRVSTKSENQEESLENQITHYKETVGSNPQYDLTEIYYDFGVSGYKEKRPGFQRMMQDARKGRFRLLITKSITRFARNTGIFLTATRELQSLGISIIFELQSINTLSQEGELLMTLFASFGQAESEGNRAGTQMAIQRKLEKGEPNCVLSRIYGYSKRQSGKAQPDKNASHVLEIFHMAADGYTVAEITGWLNSQGLRTQKGAPFRRSTVSRILSNPEYKGNFISHKYYIDDHRRQVKNTGEHDQYCFEDSLPTIVPKVLWEKAQQTVRNRCRQNIQGEEEKLPLTDKNFPYRHMLFCACCGHRLMRAYRKGRNLWECSGKERFGKNFCSGVSIPDKEIKSWSDFTENRYLFEKIARDKKAEWEYLSEAEWKESHQKKAWSAAAKAPELTEVNYPYKDKIFCKYCGSRLRRIVNPNLSVTWICNNSSRNGKKACKGIRIPDEKLHSLAGKAGIFYIGKEKIDGRKSYGYSRKQDTAKT